MSATQLTSVPSFVDSGSRVFKRDTSLKAETFSGSVKIDYNLDSLTKSDDVDFNKTKKIQLVSSGKSNQLEANKELIKKLNGVVTTVEENSVGCTVDLPTQKMVLNLPRVLFEDAVFRGYAFEVELDSSGPYKYPKISRRALKSTDDINILSEIENMINGL